MTNTESVAWFCTLSICLAACKSEKTTTATPKPAARANLSARVMPQAFEYLEIGATEEAVIKAAKVTGAGTPPIFPNLKDWIDKTYEKKLEGDDRFGNMILGFRSGRLAVVFLEVLPKNCTEEYFYGLKDAMDKKLGCKGDSWRPGEWPPRQEALPKGSFLAKWRCVPKFSEDQQKDEDLVSISKAEDASGCFMNLSVFAYSAMRWRTTKPAAKVKL